MSDTPQDQQLAAWAASTAPEEEITAGRVNILTGNQARAAGRATLNRVTAPQIDENERARREHDVRAIRHSTIMEGGSVTPETIALQDAYTRGEITEDQMIATLRKHYGLTNND